MLSTWRPGWASLVHRMQSSRTLTPLRSRRQDMLSGDHKMDSSLVSTSADVSPVSSSSSLEEDADASSSSDPLPEPFAVWWDRALSQRFLFCLSQGSFGSISVSPSLPPSLAPSYPSITPLIFVNHISFTLISISISIARSFSLSLSLSQHMCVGVSFSRWTMQA